MTVFLTVLQAEAFRMPEKSTLSETLEPSLWSWTHQTTRLGLGLGLRSTAAQLIL